jgi:hypothetical protein
VESAPRAYRLKASNAAPLSSTSAGTFPPESVMADVWLGVVVTGLYTLVGMGLLLVFT